MKIHLFGASGSGVTTLGERLAETLHSTYFDSDYYYWEPSEPPFAIRRNPEIRNRMVKEDIVNHSDWILGGSVINWGEEWLSAFDLAVFLWIPHELRMQRLKDREYTRYGDIIYSDPARNKQYNDFIAWAAGYDDQNARGRTLLAHETWIQKLTCPVLELRGDLTVAEREQKVLEQLNQLSQETNK